MGLKVLEAEVVSWPQVSAHPHRFAGREFRFGDAEIGHVHKNGVLDIPFPRSVHDLLLSEGLAEKHFWVPDSGWITFQIRGENDIRHALWLLRLSYLRYALKISPDPVQLLGNEVSRLGISPQLRSAFELFLKRKSPAAPAVAS